ncbi:DUF2254 domain-containing protein [Paeniglutamicibacter antarcticus]|uniref:DUF2254 domain-containing protein n=1 Tax=Arthrobacter terrae TaxID=2935737 RepID=A0A931CJE2_9MICC|nr:DUF2254 domain-containing protein [Arthrobacter terrae]MBG0738107.1 DUF2254 domain-containing protein [Arthrobacter terrae]
MSRPSSGRLRVALDALGSLLWPLPAIAVLVALAAGIVLPLVDVALTDDLPSDVTTYLFGGGPAAARAVLEAIASSLVTVTSLTFSLTVITLQLASSQFSPRLLRNFTADRTVHVVLTLFLGTFTFALTVLRTVRSGSGQQGDFVPQISVSLAFILEIASIMGLVFFLAHLAREIRVDTVMANVHRETTATISRLFPDRVDDAGNDNDDDDAGGHDGGRESTGDGGSAGGGGSAGDRGRPQPVPESRTAILIESVKSGFLLSIDPDDLQEAAEANNAVIRIDREPGSSIVRGTPLATAWPVASNQPLTEQNTEALRKAVSSAATIGFERTIVQDVSFGLRQLTDVAARALSPGVNDPTTAVHVLGHLSAILCDLAGRKLGPHTWADHNGQIRVIVARPGFASLLDLAIGQPRRYGIADPVVASRIFDLLKEVAWCSSTPSLRADLADQLTRVEQQMQEQTYVPADRDHLQSLGGGVRAALQGVWLEEAFTRDQQPR